MVQELMTYFLSINCTHVLKAKRTVSKTKITIYKWQIPYICFSFENISQCQELFCESLTELFDNDIHHLSLSLSLSLSVLYVPGVTDKEIT